MTPEEIVERARRMKCRVLVFKLGREVLVVGVNSAAAGQLGANRKAELVGIYTGKANPAWVAEDLGA